MAGERTLREHGIIRPSARTMRNATLLMVFAVGAWAQASGLVDSILSRWGDILYLGKQHLLLVGTSWGLAVVVGIPLGIWLSRPSMRGKSEFIMQGLNIGQTIPTLAVLALAMTILGLGFYTSVFALFLYTLLPIVRNTYAGLLTLPSYMLEAARGMGMAPGQVLWRLELPNALFVMFAGLRTALVINIGTAPLAFLIGSGGLGELIFTGIALDRTDMMLAGAIPVAFTAVVLDFVLAQVQFWAVPKGVNPLRGNS